MRQFSSCDFFWFAVAQGVSLSIYDREVFLAGLLIDYRGIACLLQTVPGSTIFGCQCTTQDENQSAGVFGWVMWGWLRGYPSPFMAER